MKWSAWPGCQSTRGTRCSDRWGINCVVGTTVKNKQIIHLLLFNFNSHFSTFTGQLYTHRQFSLSIYLYSTTQSYNYVSDTCGFQFYCKMVVNTKHSWILPHGMIRHLCPSRAELKSCVPPMPSSNCSLHHLSS